MVLSYYHILPPHTITIPESPAIGNSSEVREHQNNYGYYVSENYTYHGIVFPNGANGLIWKDNNTLVNLE